MPMRPESVKRRVLWINDEDWQAIVKQATAAGKTASVFVRERALNADHLPGPSAVAVTRAENARPGGPRIATHSVPLASPRPAPKGK